MFPTGIVLYCIARSRLHCSHNQRARMTCRDLSSGSHMTDLQSSASFPNKLPSSLKVTLHRPSSAPGRKMSQDKWCNYRNLMEMPLPDLVLAQTRIWQFQ